VAGGLRLERRLGLATDRPRQWTAWMKPTAGRGVDRAGHVTGQDHALPLLMAVWRWHRREERLGVRMLRTPIEVLAVRQLDDLSQVHDGDAGPDVLHHGQVDRAAEVAQ